MTATFYVGDVLETLAKLPEKSVDLVLSSPPFLALRSYLPADHPDKAKEGGSQATPGEYIDWLIDVVEALDRVLAPHGSLCFELGDTYAGSGGGGGDYLEGGWKEGQAQFAGSAASMKESNAAHWRQKNPPKPATGYDRKFGGTVENRTAGAGGSGWPLPKSLSLIPELFRFTLVYGFNPLTGRQTERWRLRNVIRWVRPNPPVGALGDKFRPATSELMVFCKSGKRFFDLDAVREPAKPYTDVDRRPTAKGSMAGGEIVENVHRFPHVTASNSAGAPPLDWWNIPLLEGEEPTRYGKKPEGLRNGPRANEKRQTTDFPGDPKRLDDYLEHVNPLGAPPLDWWNIPPGGYEGAHYAVWPPELCVKPIKAMCPENVCRSCGEPRRRIESEAKFIDRRGVDVTGQYLPGRNYEGNKPVPRTPGSNWGRTRTTETLGFSDCGHDNWRPGVVLDPFAGSGTTLAVATGHGRDAIGIDLDSRNYDLALQRVGPLVLQRGEATV